MLWEIEPPSVPGAQRVSTFIESYWHSPAYLNRMKDENHPLMVDWMHVSIHVKKNFYEYQLSLIHMKEFPIVCIHDLWILHHWSKEIFIKYFYDVNDFCFIFPLNRAIEASNSHTSLVDFKCYIAREQSFLLYSTELCRDSDGTHAVIDTWWKMFIHEANFIWRKHCCECFIAIRQNFKGSFSLFNKLSPWSQLLTSD